MAYLLGSNSTVNLSGKNTPTMLPVQWWQAHGLAALGSGVPHVQSAAAGAGRTGRGMRPNPRVVSKLPMKWECSRQGTALEFTSNFQVMAQLIRDGGPEKAFEGGPKRTQEAQDEEGGKMKEIMIGRLVSQDSLDWLPWGQVLKSGPISCVVGGGRVSHWSLGCRRDDSPSTKLKLPSIRDGTTMLSP